MSAVVIVILAVVLVLAVAAAVYVRRGRKETRGGLKRRFGPEYDRALDRHNGDARAAEHELSERVRRFGPLESRPLPAEEREQYRIRWAAAQQQFVDSPQQAVVEVDRLVARLAQVRGYPGADEPEHFDALSVHHGNRLHGYRKVREAARGRAGTEGMRDAMVQVRDLFDALADEGPATSHRAASDGGRTRTPGRFAGLMNGRRQHTGRSTAS